MNWKRPLGLEVDMLNDDYHKSPGISSSQAKLALKAPALYRASIAGELPHKQTPAMTLGTIVHTIILEPGMLDSDAVVLPKFKATKAGKEEKAEFMAHHAGKIMLPQADMDKAAAMANSVMALTDAEAILSDSTNELSGWYDDPETGLLCRYRPDARTDYCIADVKTCQDASPAGFSRAIENFGYALSAAHYLIGDEQLTGTTHRQFVFICVESSPPYLPAIYVLDQESLDYGTWQRRKALDIIKRCTDSGIWSTYQDGIATEIGVPYWAIKKSIEDMQ